MLYVGRLTKNVSVNLINQKLSQISLKYDIMLLVCFVLFAIFSCIVLILVKQCLIRSPDVTVLTFKVIQYR